MLGIRATSRDPASESASIPEDPRAKEQLGERERERERSNKRQNLRSIGRIRRINLSPPLSLFLSLRPRPFRSPSPSIC